jgi:hypothetical protein
LIGRIVERARRGRLVLVDDGTALIDTTVVDNAADGAGAGRGALRRSGRARSALRGDQRGAADRRGTAAPHCQGLGGRAPTRRVPYALAHAAGSMIEFGWQAVGREDEPALTAFRGRTSWRRPIGSDQRETQRALHWRPVVSLEEASADSRQQWADPRNCPAGVLFGVARGEIVALVANNEGAARKPPPSMSWRGLAAEPSAHRPISRGACAMQFAQLIPRFRGIGSVVLAPSNRSLQPALPALWGPSRPFAGGLVVSLSFWSDRSLRCGSAVLLGWNAGCNRFAEIERGN